MARVYDLNGYLLSSGLPGCIVCNDADDVILKDDDGTCSCITGIEMGRAKASI